MFSTVDEHAAAGFVGAPAGKRIGLSQGGDVLGTPIDHGQAIQMAAVFRGQGADKRRAPARVEAVIVIECAETAETGVDHPEFRVASPRKFVDVDVAGDMNASRQIAGVVFSRRVQFFRHGRHVAILPDRVVAADGQAGVIGDDTHRFGEGSKVRVEPAVIVT